jgi:polysaccharide biosynthesis/export protein
MKAQSIMASLPRIAVAYLCLLGTTLLAQAPAPAAPAQPQTQAPRVTGPEVKPPADYVIGTEDVLGVLFWRDETMSGDVLVRSDGKISIPLLNEIAVVGLTPDQLRTILLTEAKKFVADPSVTIVVRQINSRKVFVMGQVTHSGSYPLVSPTTVLQALALAGGLTEFADGKNITINRNDNGKQVSLRFNYDDVRKGKKLEQNILLKVGDTVVVP